MLGWWRALKEWLWRCPWCGQAADRPKQEYWKKTYEDGRTSTFTKPCEFPKHKYHYPELYDS